MKRIHIFRYLPEVDAFDVTPELREDWIEDLEARITAWRRDHNDDG